MTENKPVSPPAKGRVFVTGGAGHVGANLVRRLIDDGQEVRCLIQPGTNNAGLDGLPIELVEGDIRDFESTRKAVKGCKRVFHIAAKVSTLNPSAGEQRELFDINVMGTRHVMRAALEHGVSKAVLTGSFSATGYNLEDPSKPANEDLPFYPFTESMPYARSKVLAEHETLKCVVDGLDAVIATSCACIGPNDFIPSRMGRTMLDFARGKLRAYIPGGFDFVAARDIAQGHMLAMEKGRRGQKYIFSTHFHTLDDLVEYFSETTGRPKPRLRLPAPLMAGITGLYAGALARVFPNIPQRLTPGAIRILRMRRHADTTKARTELGYEPTTIRTAVYDAFAFFAREGLLPPDIQLREPPSDPPPPGETAAAAE